MSRALALLLLFACDDSSAPERPLPDAELRRVEDTGPPDEGPDARFIQDCPDGASRECGLDVGECRVGVQRCLQGLWGRCEGEAPAGPERCDGLDNDCDGRADEGFALGAPCKAEGPRGELVEGVYACEPGTGDVFCAELPDCEGDDDGDGVNACQDCDDEDPENHPGNAERCDGRDNDCDGRIDEPFPLDEPCLSGEGVCRRGGRRICDPRGLDTLCDAEPAPPEGPELCGDDTDEDCDGRVDEGFDVGAPCFAGVGACRRDGFTACTRDGSGVECGVEPGAPRDEVCGNGIDDDCDGRTDEGFPVGAECRAGVGACARLGAMVCAEGGVACDAQPADPVDELCGNRRDDDCDGVTDEGFDAGEACAEGVGVCHREGVRVCNAAGNGTRCSAQSGEPLGELCGNGADDDCDGAVDEGFDVGAPCEVGVGVCRRQGRGVCGPDRAEVVCDARPGPAAQERCDGLDNDCDGTTDEGYPLGEACEVGEGACRNAGRGVCAAAEDRVVCDVAPLPPELERCDERDNDCDGAVDEDFPELGQACDDEDPDLCARGFVACDPPTGRAVCLEDIPSPEACNYLDDDCDDAVDEAFDLRSDPRHCGACGNACDPVVGRCEDALCWKDYWVWASEGSDADGDGTRANPWRTITHATRVAQGPRAIIHVLPGTYSVAMHPDEHEAFPIELNDGVTITGEGNPQEVVVDGAYGGTVLVVDGTEDPTTSVRRLTIVHGGAGRDGFAGAVVLREARVYFLDVTIDRAIADRTSAAIHSVGGAVALEHCTVSGAESSTAKAIVTQATSGELRVLRSHFVGNQAGAAPSAGAVLVGEGSEVLLWVENSTFVNNSSSGIRVGTFSAARVVHSNFAGNGDSGLYIRANADPVEVVNNVFANNGFYGGRTQDPEPAPIRTNLFFANGEGAWSHENRRYQSGVGLNDAWEGVSGNFDGNPRFFSLAAGNTRPLEGSAVVDRAEPDQAPLYDQDGRLRPLGEGPDVGAFELAPR